MRWRGFPGKRWAPIRDGITTADLPGWRTSNGNPSSRGAGYHPRVSDRPTGSSLRDLLGTRRGRAAALLVALAVAGACGREVWRAGRDPLSPARWIGLHEAAAPALPGEVAFVKELDLAEPLPRPVLVVEGDREWQVRLDGRLIASGSGPGVRELPLSDTIPAGHHLVVATARHAEGLASIRLRLDGPARKGIGVVTGRGWVADDDASRIRDRGRKGARYRAMVWGRPPISSWSASSVTRSLRTNGGSSIDAESSRIPSRAEAQ